MDRRNARLREAHLNVQLGADEVQCVEFDVIGGGNGAFDAEHEPSDGLVHHLGDISDLLDVSVMTMFKLGYQ